MKSLWTLVLVSMMGSALHAADRWKMIDEGFRFIIPWDWTKKKVQGIDSHVGEYRGKKAYLQFDGVCGPLYTVADSDAAIAKLKSFESDRRLLGPGEELWRVDGRLALFKVGSVDPKIYGVREFSNVAELSVPYEGEDCYLSVMVFFDSQNELSDVVRILRSFSWPKKPANPQSQRHP